MDWKIERTKSVACGSVFMEFLDPIESSTLSLEAKINGKIQPSTLEIFPSIIDENLGEFSGDSELKTDFDNGAYFNEKFKNILTDDDNLFMNNFEETPETVRNIEDTSGRRTINKLSDATKEGFTARKGTTRNLNGFKSHHTTKRSIDLTSPKIPKEKSLNPKYPSEKSLFLDSDRTVGNLAAKLKPLTNDSNIDVVQRGLEKDGNRMTWLGGETAKELLDIQDIPSESQVVLPGNIMTKLSVQETVDGQTIQRKPTKEEFYLAQSELDAINDILGRDYKGQNKETNNTSDLVVDVDTFLRPEPGFADDDADDFIGDWSHDDDDSDDDDIDDMESILKDDTDVFKRFRMKGDSGDSNIMEMEPPNGDYRTIFHSESKNFSNVKEERIEISEAEGDSFDDDNDPFPMIHSTKENVTVTTFSSSNNTNNITPSSVDKEINNSTTTTNLAETTIPITTTVNSVISEASTVSTAATEPVGSGDGEILAENGISIKDFSDITSLLENGSHEIEVPSNEKAIVTTISIQEIVDGQTIERKPTDEELRSIETTTISEVAEISTKKDDSTTVETDTTTQSTTTLDAKDNVTTLNVESVDEFSTSTVGSATIISVDTSTVELLTESNGETSTSSTLKIGNIDSIQTSTAAEDVNDVLNRFINDIDKIEEHEITPSEVESMFNSKIEEYEDEDYESKEHSDVINVTKENGDKWTVFGDVKEAENNVGLNETDKNETIEVERQMVPMVPTLKAMILNSSAEFNVKISTKDDTFYVPSFAYIKEYDNIINITWRITEGMNNSVAMRIFERDEFYMIKEIITHLFGGNQFKTQQKLVAFHPDPVMDDTMAGRTRIVMMKDGTYITFSNVEFLKKLAPTNGSREISEATTSDPKLWHFEVASICIVTIIIVALVMYVIAIKTRAKVTLREKDELPQVTHC